MTRTALYPGTFDPITNGHLDIIRRASNIADRVIVGVARNEDKRPLFSLDERVAMVEAEAARVAPNANITARPFSSLLIHFAKEIGASMIVRGLRAVSDFEYEFQMVAMNQRLDPDIETVFLMAAPDHQAIAARLVKEIARLEGNVSAFVPSDVERRLKEKFA